MEVISWVPYANAIAIATTRNGFQKGALAVLLIPTAMQYPCQIMSRIHTNDWTIFHSDFGRTAQMANPVIMLRIPTRMEA